MSVTREEINTALFALIDNLAFGGDPFVTKSRKFRHFANVVSDEQPALFQTEPSEGHRQATGMRSVRSFYAVWTIYFTSDPQNRDDVPAIRMNEFVESLEALFPSDDPDNRQTLGGLVHHAFIEGELVKVAGDDDGQGLIVIPITILVP